MNHHIFTQILDGVDLLHESDALRVADRRDFLLAQLFHGLLVVAQVALGAHEYNGHVGTVVRHLRVPLGARVLVRSRTHDGEAHDEYIGLRVGHVTQLAVVLLAGRVPQAEVDRSAVDHHVDGEVVEHGGYVLARQRVGRIRD